jgi:hypothetical protein
MVGAPIKASNPTPPLAQKPRPTPPLREPGSSPKKTGRLGPVLRLVISIWIVWHFAGVFLAALSISGGSDLVINVAQGGWWTTRPMQWYLDALYLNQGHSFFAPEVGPGHFIQYRLFDQSNREIEHGEFPSRKDQWPRLLYHRYFMLADQCDVPTDNKQEHDYWERRYLEAYARQLLRANENAQVAQLQRFNHWPVRRRDFVEGVKLTDQRTYEKTIEVTQRRSDLGPLPANQTLNWQGGRFDTANRWMGGPPPR